MWSGPELWPLGGNFAGEMSFKFGSYFYLLVFPPSKFSLLEKFGTNPWKYHYMELEFSKKRILCFFQFLLVLVFTSFSCFWSVTSECVSCVFFSGYFTDRHGPLRHALTGYNFSFLPCHKFTNYSCGIKHCAGLGEPHIGFSLVNICAWEIYTVALAVERACKVQLSKDACNQTNSWTLGVYDNEAPPRDPQPAYKLHLHTFLSCDGAHTWKKEGRCPFTGSVYKVQSEKLHH